MKTRSFAKIEKESFMDLDNMETHIGVSTMYADLVRQYAGKTIHYLPFNVQSENYKTKIKMIRKLIKICTDLGTTFDVYMKVQFEKLVPWLKREKNLEYPPFNMLVSSGAITRFNQWKEVHHKKYESKKEAQKATVPVQPNIRRAILESAEKFYQRLVKKDKENVLLQLEILTRAGFVTKMYAYSHPWVKEGGYYLKSVWQEMDTKLTKFEKETIQEMRKIVEEKYGVEYV